MCLPPFERELLYEEYWSLWQSTKLPDHWELSVQERQKLIQSRKQENKIYQSSIRILMKKLVLKIRNI